MNTSSKSAPVAESTTHEHLLSVVATECKRFTGPVVSILDAGCGQGKLMEWLEDMLPRIHPQLQWNIRGFDVSDHGSVGGKSLPSRIMQISISDLWPYPDASFDVVISNQVMEHVANPQLFLSELHRVLKPGGFAAHLFPLKHYIWEGHLHLPFVHRIRNTDLRRSYIRLLSRLGLGRFRDHHANLGVDLMTFSRQHDDFITFFTRYMDYREALELSSTCGFRGSFRYTREYYTRKLRKMLGRQPSYAYKADRSAIADWLSVILLRYIASVTFFLEKENIYSHGTEERVRDHAAANRPRSIPE